MVARLICGAIQGVDAFRVDLEVDLLRKGLPAFVMVGLAEGAVREAKERVFAALRSSGFRLPPARVTVNLAPADRRKGGSGYDLPLAVGLLTAAGLLPEERVQGWFLVGELSLSGEIRPVPGVLPLALLARAEGAAGLVVAPENASEAALAGIPAYGAASLTQAAGFLAGEVSLERAEAPAFSPDGPAGPDDAGALPDFADVKGQEHAKRAVEIAAAGGHNLLFIGPPGSGKTMLAQRIPSVLPPLSFAEALEATKIHSVAGLLGNGGILRRRPFRSPHHTVSDVALVGGGSSPRPGEVSLAHRGVLFLDELPEYGKAALEALRQPLEDGSITVSRAVRSVDFPARCMLVAAMNPCPCGYATDPERACVCSGTEIRRYRARLSGPLLDRIDLHVAVPAVPFDDLRAAGPAVSSAAMRERVLAAREIQRRRYTREDDENSGNARHACRTNAELSGALLEEHCRLGEAENAFLREAMRRLRLSARAYTRILRVSRTIADLDAAERTSGPIEVRHLAEAINCRVLDREEW